MSGNGTYSVSAPTEADLALIDRWVVWVAGHRDTPPDPADAGEFLHFLQALLSVDFARDWGFDELYAVGMTLGEVLRRRHGLQWVVIEDAEGRDIALQLPDDPVTGAKNIKVFPGHMVARHEGRPHEIDLDGYEDFLLYPERWES